jgi:hypothetical protein
LRHFLAARSRGLVTAAHAIPRRTLCAGTARSEFVASRAWSRILNAMPTEPTVRMHANRVAAWRTLRPQGQLEVFPSGLANPWDTSSTVVVGYIVVGRVRQKYGVAEGAWSLAFHDRALKRLAQHDTAANEITAMTSAHDVLLGAPVSLAPELVHSDGWTLPAGAGAFVIRMRGVLLGNGDTALLATAADWLPTADLSAAQRDQAVRIGANHNERSLGERALLPADMRPAAPPFALPGEVSPACDIPL